MNIQLIEDKITEKGLNKATIAKEMGMSKQSFNAFLKSDNPTLQKLRALSIVLGVTITSLIDEESEEDIKKRSQEIVAFVRYKGIHYTADSLEEFNTIVEEIRSITNNKKTMTQILIICGVFIGLSIIIIAYNALKGSKKTVTNSNPIDGIRPGGILGFELGDDYLFCLSRFKHLNLSVDRDELNNSSSTGTVTWGKGVFNSINEVRFRFENKRLTFIVIDIDFSCIGIKDMYGILVSRICKVLGKEPVTCTPRKAVWKTTRSEIELFRYMVPVLEEEVLLIRIS